MLVLLLNLSVVSLLVSFLIHCQQYATKIAGLLMMCKKSIHLSTKQTLIMKISLQNHS